MKLIESLSVRKLVSLVIQHVITVFVLKNSAGFSSNNDSLVKDL